MDLRAVCVSVGYNVVSCFCFHRFSAKWEFSLKEVSKAFSASRKLFVWHS